MPSVRSKWGAVQGNSKPGASGKLYTGSNFENEDA